MGLAIDYRKEIINVSKELPEEKLKEFESKLTEKTVKNIFGN